MLGHRKLRYTHTHTQPRPSKWQQHLQAVVIWKVPETKHRAVSRTVSVVDVEATHKQKGKAMQGEDEASQGEAR